MFPCLRFNKQGEMMKPTKVIRIALNEHLIKAENQNYRFEVLAWSAFENEVCSKVTNSEGLKGFFTTYVESQNPLKVKHKLELV